MNNENMLNDSCSICYNILNKPILEPNCQYLFCGQCFFNWLEINNSCPMCRHNINIQELVYIETENTNTIPYSQNLRKMIINNILVSPSGLIFKALISCMHVENTLNRIWHTHLK